MAHPSGSDTHYPKRRTKYTKKNHIERYPSMYTLPSVAGGDAMSKQVGDYTSKGVSRPSGAPKPTAKTRNSTGDGLSFGNMIRQ